MAKVLIGTSMRVLNLFSQQEALAAFAALRETGLCGVSGVSGVRLHSGSSAPSEALKRFVSVRPNATGGGTRIHMEIPLRFLSDTPHSCTSSNTTSVRHFLPPPVLRICDGLRAAAEAHATLRVQSLAHLQPLQQEELLGSLEPKSVLRLLQYEVGTGCRPHLDPGLCTALLLGSEAGLEVAVPGSSLRDGDTSFDKDMYGSYDDSDLGGDSGGVEEVFHGVEWIPVRAEEGLRSAAVMNGRMLQVLSKGAMPGVAHRVCTDWACGADREQPVGQRYNIVVELRPAKAKKWYRLISGS